MKATFCEQLYLDFRKTHQLKKAFLTPKPLGLEQKGISMAPLRIESTTWSHQKIWKSVNGKGSYEIVIFRSKSKSADFEQTHYSTSCESIFKFVKGDDVTLTSEKIDSSINLGLSIILTCKLSRKRRPLIKTTGKIPIHFWGQRHDKCLKCHHFSLFSRIMERPLKEASNNSWNASSCKRLQELGECSLWQHDEKNVA